MTLATIFDAIPQGDRNERGFAGEFFARKLLEKSGYIVEYHKQGSKRGDLQAIDSNGVIFDVEVKTARRRADGRFCFHLICNGKKSVTDYRHSDYVMLIAVSGNGIVSPFLIGREFLERRGAKTITLPNKLNGSMWADFRVKGTVRL